MGAGVTAWTEGRVPPAVDDGSVLAKSVFWVLGALQADQAELEETRQSRWSPLLPQDVCTPIGEGPDEISSPVAGE